MRNIRLPSMKKISRIFNSQMRLRDVFQKLCWLEFENESILKFLAKYDIIMHGTDNPENLSKENLLQSFVDLTQEEKFIPVFQITEN